MINRYREHLLMLIAALVLCVITSAIQANNTLYRYENDQGTKVISDVISPYYAAKGYDVIDSRGNIVKTVPAELSPAEKEQKRKARVEQERLDKWDQELRSRYHSVKDIESTKKRRLKGIDNSITSLQLTLENISKTIKYYQAEAAANERQGETIPKETLASMARLQADRDFIEQEIGKRQARRTDIVSKYQKDIDRFKVIINQ
ncbi:hypothetical protein ACVBE9_09100 [Eionea flava]